MDLWMIGPEDRDDEGNHPDPAMIEAAQKRQRRECPRTGTLDGKHVWEPDWQGRSYSHMRCRWCGKREAV
jgi:hypothetical protein